MERLTARNKNGRAIALCCAEKCEHECECKAKGIDECEGVIKLIYRLADIEDILGDDYDLSRLRELVEADREGRCVVLPCKIGGPIYRVGASICKWRDTDQCDEYCNGYEYRDCWEGGRAVIKEEFRISQLDLLNKTVFLTREAAEAALKSRKTNETKPCRESKARIQKAQRV